MEANTDRAHLSEFLTALDASPTTLERPVCRGWLGEYQITGRSGHILADPPGFLLYVVADTKRGWTIAKGRLRFATVMQDGDEEGCLHLARLPTAKEADTIRDVIGIRKRRYMTAEAKSAARVNLDRYIWAHKRDSMRPIGRPATTTIAAST